MKNILNAIFVILPFFMLHGQIKEPVHLSFNLGKEYYDLRKIKEGNGVIHFYIGNQHFKSMSKIQSFKESKIKNPKKNQVLNISEFLNLANEERQRLIVKGEKNKSIKILFNNNVFDIIYLYVKDENDFIIKYLVSWVEEIE